MVSKNRENKTPNIRSISQLQKTFARKTLSGLKGSRIIEMSNYMECMGHFSDRERTRSAQPALRMTHAIVMSQFSRHLEQPQPQFLGTG